MSLRLRLTLWYTGVLAVTLLLFGVALYLFISVTTKNNIEQSLVDQGNKVISQIQVVSIFNTDLFKLPELNDFKSAGTFIQANLVDGKTDKSNFKGYLPFSRDADFARAKQEESWFSTYTDGDYSLLVYHIRMEVNERFLGVLQVAIETSNDHVFLDNLRNVLLILSLATVAIAATLGSYLARKALKPIDHVIAAANRIEKGEDLGQRIKHVGPNDEIGRLTETINSMLGRIESTYKDLEGAYRTQRRFISDASHELRTPLTTIRGNVDLLQKMWKDNKGIDDKALSLEAMSDISQEAERMSRLVSDLLALARADAGQQIITAPIELKPIVEEVIRKAHFLPHRAEWLPGNLDKLDGAYVQGNADYLQQLLFIFIENAFKYTPEGTVRMDALRMSDQIGIRLQDTGIGIDSEEIPHIFERFFRADASRGQTAGTGLGLSIAKWIIDEMSGSIEVVSKKNEGSLFIIWLPLIDPSDS
jgi:two-component system OmpR family sensor kinase